MTHTTLIHLLVLPHQDRQLEIRFYGRHSRQTYRRWQLIAVATSGSNVSS